MPVITGRQKLVKVFNTNIKTVKADVCPYIKEEGYAQSLSLILKAVEGIYGFSFDFPIVGTVNSSLVL